MVRTLAIAALAAALTSIGAYAADSEPAAHPDKIQIDAAACRLAAQQGGEAGADYVPGVDIDGDPVVPADLPTGRQPIKAPTRFFIPVTANLSQKLGLTPGLQEKAYVGLITVDDGKLAFDGQPLGNDADSEIARLCAERAKPADLKSGGAR